MKVPVLAEVLVIRYGVVQPLEGSGKDGGNLGVEADERGDEEVIQFASRYVAHGFARIECGSKNKLQPPIQEGLPTTGRIKHASFFQHGLLPQ